MNANIKVIASAKSWIEGDAVRQLEKTAELPGVIEAIGMPGLHPGQGCPVDAVFVTQGIIYPHLIGTDIGCGMSLWGTSIKPVQPERLAKKLNLEHGVDDPAAHLGEVKPCGYEHSLGTIGRGNHFAELLAVDEIRDQNVFDAHLKNYRSFLLVHSGSRGYGEHILYEHTAVHQAKGLAADSAEAGAYITQHDHAVEWARVNRRVIAARFFEPLGAVATEIHQSVHNLMEFDGRDENGAAYWIHRKGAIPTRGQPFVVIPGSRGAHSYVVSPTGDQSLSRWSVSHGAGRKMSRHDAIEKLARGTRRWSRTVSVKDLERTKFGSVVICEDRMLMMEEAPEAYKPIHQVVQDLVDHGLVNVVALLKPVLTYKMKRT